MMAAASDELKAHRLPIIARVAVSHRKSRAMRAMWERRRAELRVFEGDEIDDDKTESAGNADAELDGLPDLI